MKSEMVACKKCDREFSTIQGLSMHNYRVHTHKGRRHKTVNQHTRKAKAKRLAAARENGVHRIHHPVATLDEMTARYTRAAEVAAALAFLRQHGTVEFKEHSL